MLPLCDYEKRKMFSSTFYKFKYVKPEKTLSGPLDVAQSQREREKSKGVENPQIILLLQNTDRQ
jgi:hypothetical protein